MGWYPRVVANTIEDKLTDEFYIAMGNHLASMRSNGKSLPDTFADYDKSWDIEDDFRFRAFDSDAMEHMGSWVFDSNTWPVFNSLKITGDFILWHEDGGGYYSGIRFIDGVPYDVDVTETFVTGAPLVAE
jgi:hypothetical protein